VGELPVEAGSVVAVEAADDAGDAVMASGAARRVSLISRIVVAAAVARLR